VPQALEAFFEADSFESAIRNAVSIGGDVDTIAAIAGSIAEAKWGVSTEIVKSAKRYIDKDFMKISNEFLNFFVKKQNKIRSI
jgi:type I restriction enzyme M protein